MVLLIPRAYPFPGKLKRNALILSFSIAEARFTKMLKSYQQKHNEKLDASSATLPLLNRLHIYLLTNKEAWRNSHLLWYLNLKVLSLHNNLLEKVERKFASTCIILIQVIPKLPLVLIFVWLDAVQSSRGWALAKYWCSTGITQCALPRALPN